MTTWVLERDVFLESGARFEAAVRSAGHPVVLWDDAWWTSGAPPALEGQVVVFRGALANAARVDAETSWRPGSFCDPDSFRCSAWYEDAEPWLLHSSWALTTVQGLCKAPRAHTEGLADEGGRVFVRPDSPLKPFSGRVVGVEGLTPEHLDHGYYYDDLALPVVIAPVRDIRREWRFVVVGGRVVAGCEYIADGRNAGAQPVDAAPHAMASEIGATLPAPADIYVLDLCEVGGELRLIELNPFGGADLYGCDADAVVSAVAEHLT